MGGKPVPSAGQCRGQASQKDLGESGEWGEHARQEGPGMPGAVQVGTSGTGVPGGSRWETGMAGGSESPGVDAGGSGSPAEPGGSPRRFGTMLTGCA